MTECITGTFTGLPKPLVFADAHQRFAQFQSKIVYEAILGPPGSAHEDPWQWEAHQRNTMNALLASHATSTQHSPLVLFSDVDEIPAAHALRLLRGCAFASPIHLQMRTFLYSFEWPIGWGSWRAQLHEWKNETYYRHSKATAVALADAGWHCSYCFRQIADFVEKMQGVRHNSKLQDIAESGTRLLACRQAQRRQGAPGACADPGGNLRGQGHIWHATRSVFGEYASLPRSR